MSSLLEYIAAPYILTEEELRSKPLADILEFTQHIEKVIGEIASNYCFKIHSENVKTLNKILSKSEKIPQSPTAH